MEIGHFLILLPSICRSEHSGRTPNTHKPQPGRSQTLYSYEIDIAEVKMRISERVLRSSYRSVERLIEHMRRLANR